MAEPAPVTGKKPNMGKTVDYYLGLPYTIEMTPEEDGGWFVAVKELPGCMSEGNDPADAIAMIRDAMRAWIEVRLEDGQPVPEPRKAEEYSGRFLARVPASLHRDLVEAAAREGVSLNQYVNVALARTADRPVRDARPAAQPSAATGPCWSMLQDNVRQALLEAGLAGEASELDEKLFAERLKGLLSQAGEAIRDDRFDEAGRCAAVLREALSAVASNGAVVDAFLYAVELIERQAAAATLLRQGAMDKASLRARIDKRATEYTQADSVAELRRVEAVAPQRGLGREAMGARLIMGVFR